MTANLYGRIKATVLLYKTSITSIEQSIYTTEEAGASHIPSQYSVSPSSFNITQLIAEQMAVARNDMVKLVIEQVIFTLATYRTGNIQSPPK